MSSPSSAGGNNGSPAGIRKGTRVILREITANLQNSSPGVSPSQKSGNEASPLKGEQLQQQHDVKVRFIREFADAGAAGTETITDTSLSSASSFQSLTSTLSSKCSSGICADSSNINLGDTIVELAQEESFTLHLDAEDLSGDQTFTSATDRISLDRIVDQSRGNSPINFNNELESNRTFETRNKTVRIHPDEDSQCGTSDIAEFPRFHRTNSNLERTADATFVRCSSDLAQEIPQVTVNREPTNAAKTENYSETLEIPAETNDIRKVLDNTFEKQVDVSEAATFAKLEEILSTESSGVITAEEAKRLILNDTIDLSTPPFFEEAKRLIRLEKSLEVAAPVTPETLSVIAAEGASSLVPSDFEPSRLSDIAELSDALSRIRLLPEIGESDVPDKFEIVDGTGPIALPADCLLSEKLADDEIRVGNSGSAIEELTSLNTQELAEDSTIRKDNSAIEESVNSRVPREHISIEEIAEIQSRDLALDVAAIDADTIEEGSQIFEDSGSSVEQTLPSEHKVAAEDEVPEVEVQKHNADTSSTSVHCEDLDETVKIQDLSAEHLFAVPECDQYAKFLPNRQSTDLVAESRSSDSNKRGSIAVEESLIRDHSESRLNDELDEYAAFTPQKQSTNLAAGCVEPENGIERRSTAATCSLPDETLLDDKSEKISNTPEQLFDDRCDFSKLELEAIAVVKDIRDKSLEFDEDNERFVSASDDLFTDPGGFDFLLSKTPRRNTNRNLRAESLYVKFDPLVSNASMLPQGNIQSPSPTTNEERNGENNATIENIGTPMRNNPALAAIDRLLFFSPMTNVTPTNTTTIQKTNDAQEKVEPIEETNAEKVNMAKELELVRSTVIQLEDQLEKLKIDNEDKRASYLEKINQLHSQLAQEIEKKNQVTVVADEYEKSISRFVAERERDRKNHEVEKAKLQEELTAAKHHLENLESAFNDVHLKYERLKAVVNTYKVNEIAFEESLQENLDIIKALENRYEQVKSHAAARLEKANQDLESIRKQHESETVRLHAMLKKTELKCNSLAESVEQKTKENKELTAILDEIIARVGRNGSE